MQTSPKEDKSKNSSKSESFSLSTDSLSLSSEESTIQAPDFILEPKEQFTYENLVENFVIMGKAVMGHRLGSYAAAHIPDTCFIMFGHKDNEIETSVGWKAHISIDDSDKDNLAKAWDVVKDIIIDEEITGKVVLPDADFYKDNKQCGKQITLYCFMSPDKDWENIFNKIENALVAEDIKGSRFSPGDKQLNGSMFISYRNDNDGNGNYVTSETDHNPSHQEDIFENIQVQPCGVRFHL